MELFGLTNWWCAVKQFDYSQPYDPINGWKARAPFARFFESEVELCLGCKTGALIVPGAKECGTCKALTKKLVTL